MNAVPHEDTLVLSRLRSTLAKLDLNDYTPLQEWMEDILAGQNAIEEEARRWYRREFLLEKI